MYFVFVYCFGGFEMVYKLKEILKSKSETAQYLNGEKKIEVPTERRKGNIGRFAVIHG